MAKRFEGATAWITGGGTGIGKALALELARRGADVAVSGRREDRLRSAVTEIEALGRHAIPVVCDVTDEQSVEAAAQRVADEFGGISITVANAGYAVSGRLETLSAEDWRRQLDVNVVGLASTAKHALPHLKRSRGRLGLVGSVAAFMPVAKTGAYVASKYAVRAIGQTLCIELAGSGVSCTTMHPGFVESEIAQVDNAGVHDGSRKDKRPQNLMWTSDKAGRVMADALYKRKKELVFTGHGKVGAFFGQHFPGLAVLAQTRGK
ncbi:MAG: SDR family NAD(P)-dependent oxidoreductase [Sandaracinaceae bacterium]